MSPSKTYNSSVIKPTFTFNPSSPDSPQIQSLIKTLHLTPHVEGGYFVETDRAQDTIPSPFPNQDSSTSASLPTQRPGFDPSLRNSSTSIFYLLTPQSPRGCFHRNAGRTVHTLHRGRGRYVIIHADEARQEKRVETFVVGQDVTKGEKLQWIVEGGKYKASLLLPDEDGGSSSQGLLISETVVPGFEFCDHDFLTEDGLRGLVSQVNFEESNWLLRPE